MPPLTLPLHTKKVCPRTVTVASQYVVSSLGG
jgi:hypothetical protein